MKKYDTAGDLAKDKKISEKKLKETFEKYNKGAEANNDEFKKRFFPSAPFNVNDKFHVSIVTPIVHYVCIYESHENIFVDVIILNIFRLYVLLFRLYRRNMVFPCISLIIAHISC